MSRIIIDFETDTAAFLDPDGEPDAYTQQAEVVRILKQIAEQVAHDIILPGMPTLMRVRDVNGNSIGSVDWRA